MPTHPVRGRCRLPVRRSPVAGFEIDGNLCTDTAGNQDWDTVGGQPVENDGASDSTQFTSGASENNWPWSPAQADGVDTAGNKADITNVYESSETVGGNVYARFGFERVANTGSVSYASN